MPGTFPRANVPEATSTVKVHLAVDTAVPGSDPETDPAVSLSVTTPTMDDRSLPGEHDITIEFDPELTREVAYALLLAVHGSNRQGD